jgi:hypothetical protein
MTDPGGEDSDPSLLLLVRGACALPMRVQLSQYFAGVPGTSDVDVPADSDSKVLQHRIEKLERDAAAVRGIA